MILQETNKLQGKSYDSIKHLRYQNASIRNETFETKTTYERVTNKSKYDFHQIRTFSFRHSPNKG